MSRGPSAGRATTASTYASATSGPSSSYASLRGISSTRPTASIAAEISTSAGGTIWLRVLEVDLVAVVLRRVVRCRDHDAGAAAEVPDREREDRRRQVRRQQEGVDAGALHDLGGVAGEDLGVVPRVVADHDRGRRAVLQQVGREAGGGLGDDDAVHPVGAGAERSAQSRGAELQPRPSKRSSSPALSPASMSACSSSTVTASGSWLSHVARHGRGGRRSWASLQKAGGSWSWLTWGPPTYAFSASSSGCGRHLVGVRLGVVLWVVPQRATGTQVPPRAGVGGDAVEHVEPRLGRRIAASTMRTAVAGRQPGRQLADAGRAARPEGADPQRDGADARRSA